jgi:lysophospholipase L1-like esterase
MFRNKFRNMIDVLNRGIGGQEAPAELLRLATDVIQERPSLLIWQVGTNSVWQPESDHPPTLEQTIDAVKAGVNEIRGWGEADIILMDPQYAPAMITPAKIDATNAMVAALANTADALKVNLFQRFKLMKAWHEIDNVPIEQLVDPNDPNRLHDSDWATDQLAQSFVEIVAARLDPGL